MNKEEFEAVRELMIVASYMEHLGRQFMVNSSHHWDCDATRGKPCSCFLESHVLMFKQTMADREKITKQIRTQFGIEYR